MIQSLKQLNPCITILLILCSINSFAQTDGDTTNLGNVEVVTTYKPDVAQSEKISIRPVLEDPKVDHPTYSYIFPNVAYKPNSVYTPIDPVFTKPEPAIDLFDNYIEVGGGNYLTSYLDASIHNTQDKYHTYGLKVKHHAASASNNPEQALFSQNQIKAFGFREKGNDLYAEIDYQRNVVHYYGYLVDTPSMELDDINQIYNDINVKTAYTVKKNRAQNQLDFNLNLFDKLGENENSFNLANSSSFKLGKNHLHIDIDALYTQLTETADYKRLFVDVKPYYEFDYKKWKLDVGLNLSLLEGIDTSISDIAPAPYLRAETYLVPKLLRFYAGLDGGYIRNTLRSISYENLFLGNNFTLSNPISYSGFIGMNGSFKRFVEYGIKMKQEQITNQYFFVNDTNELRNFTTVVADLTRFTFSGEFKIDVNQNLDIGFRGNYYALNVGAEIQEAWHMPTYDASLFATIRLADKIYVNGGYFTTSNRQAASLAGKDDALPAINDINIGAEYRYKKNISGFLHINNLLNQRYDLWNQYRAQGLNVLAGVTFSL